MKIISNGNPVETHIYDENGNDISKYITSIKWEISASKDYATCILETYLTELDATIDKENVFINYRKL